MVAVILEETNLEFSLAHVSKCSSKGTLSILADCKGFASNFDVRKMAISSLLEAILGYLTD